MALKSTEIELTEKNSVRLAVCENSPLMKTA